MLPLTPLLFLTLSGLGIQLCKYRCGSNSRCKSVLYNDQQLTCGMSNVSLADLKKKFLNKESVKSVSFHKPLPLCAPNTTKTKYVSCVSDKDRKHPVLEDLNAIANNMSNKLQQDIGIVSIPTINSCHYSDESFRKNIFKLNGLHMHVFNFSTARWTSLVKFRGSIYVADIIADSAMSRMIYVRASRFFSSSFKGKNKKLLTNTHTSGESNMYLDKTSQELIYVTQKGYSAIFRIISTTERKPKGKLILKIKKHFVMNRCIAGDPTNKTLYIFLSPFLRSNPELFSVSYDLLNPKKAKLLLKYKSVFFLVLTPCHELMWYDAKEHKIIIHSLPITQAVLFEYKVNGVVGLEYIQNQILVCVSKRSQVELFFLKRNYKRNQISVTKYSDEWRLIVG